VPIVKQVSPSGQISLGKRYAGKTVIIEQPEDGVWVIKTAITIPENELWLHHEPFKSKLDAAIQQAEGRNASETDLDEFEKAALKQIAARQTCGDDHGREDGA
jgi:hypothetical protein